MKPDHIFEIRSLCSGKSLDITAVAARMRWLSVHEPAVLLAGQTKKAATATAAEQKHRGSGETVQPFLFRDVGAQLAYELTGVATTCVAGAGTTGTTMFL